MRKLAPLGALVHLTLEPTDTLVQPFDQLALGDHHFVELERELFEISQLDLKAHEALVL